VVLDVLLGLDDGLDDCRRASNGKMRQSRREEAIRQGGVTWQHMSGSIIGGWLAAP
jgi:hypothetical protein